MEDRKILPDLPEQPTGKRPDTKAMYDLPVYDSFDTWGTQNTVAFVRGVLSELAVGNLNTSAQLVDQMRRDDRIAGCFDTRMNGLLGAPMEFEPGSDGRKQESVIKEVRERFQDFIPNSALTQLLGWARWLGAGLGEIVWRREKTEWTPRLKVWHPRFMFWRWDTRSFWVNTEGGTVEVEPGNGRWILLAPWGAQRGWSYGLIRTLAPLWLMRQWALRDWARYSEVHGLPTRLALVPKDASEDDKQRFQRELARISSESVVKIPTGNKDEASFDVKLLEAMGKSNEGFEQFLTRLDKSIAIAILGQNLTTEVNGGSFAAANVHDRIRRDFLKSDAEALAQCLREQFFKPWALYNHGDADISPHICWQVQATEDKGQNALALMNLGQALVSLEQAGMAIDIPAVAAQFGIPLTPEGVLPKVDPQKTVDAQEAELDAQKDNPPTQQAADAADAKAKADAQKPKPKATSQATDGEVTPAMVAGQTYVDEVADEFRDEAKKAIAPDLARILKALEASEDYEDLRKNLIHAYGQISPRKLSTLMRDALTIAKLTGWATGKVDGSP